ncbi:MAG TPA: hypothetical protein EYQ60_13900 [Myxococcales bacterium]|nr:hypothetical protein [Myxococcales bacterium]
MPFVKGNTIGAETRFKTGESGSPAGRPPDKLRRFINAELDENEREATGKQEAATKLEVLAERIVEDAIAGCIPSRKMLVDRLYPALNKHELANAEGQSLTVRWEREIHDAVSELDRILEEQKKRDAEGQHCDACGSPVRDEAPSLGMPQ